MVMTWESDYDLELDDNIDDCIEAMSHSSPSYLYVTTVYIDSDDGEGDLLTDPVVISSS